MGFLHLRTQLPAQCSALARAHAQANAVDASAPNDFASWQGRDVRVERMVERVLVVNSLIRLPSSVAFAPLPVARQTPRLAEAAARGPTKLYNPLRLLYDKEYYQIESSMQDVS